MLDGVPNEIVIVRRKNSWEDAEPTHGVWKIAYADFMTALMAFFLVMWLINVTDDSVRRGVAQYFNPVKLASTAPNRKGLNDPQINGDTNENGTKLFMGKLGGSEAPVDQDENFGQGLETGHKIEEAEEKPEQGAVPASGQFTQIHSESILFSDPYAVLDTLSEKIRVEKSDEDSPRGIGTGLQKNEGTQGGQAYRDPFDPMFWQFRPGRGVEGVNPEPFKEPMGEGEGSGPSNLDLEGEFAWGAPSEDNRATIAGELREDTKGTVDVSEAVEPLVGSGGTSYEFDKSREGKPFGGNGELDPVVAHVMGRFAGKAANVVAQPADDGRQARAVSDSSKTAAQTIVTKLSEVLTGTRGTVLEATASQIKVTRESEGTLISLTDDQNFGMFAIGSAEPRPELVKLLKRIGEVITGTTGQIVIKGHTDARPFRSKTYDNWRLSSARAHMALYMLTRGGVSKERFDRVEGYADRHLKDPDDPFAAGNRRIEIYLLEGGQ
ncbi:MAG: MotB family protein [Roseibium sp.]|uniref:MotB family protein n=1 Tax=Roseibium sp. TaxID=1936156 RepID=UPI00262866D4|nr:MotB family protein [Roseibium sp.]MCV0428328.1 MotB family protein [Roseibium sp.]